MGGEERTLGAVLDCPLCTIDDDGYAHQFCRRCFQRGEGYPSNATRYPGWWFKPSGAAPETCFKCGREAIWHGG